MASQPTRFGSLQHFEKGGVEVIKDDARNYVFSNVFVIVRTTYVLNSLMQECDFQPTDLAAIKNDPIHFVH